MGAVLRGRDSERNTVLTELKALRTRLLDADPNNHKLRVSLKDRIDVLLEKLTELSRH